MRQRIPVFREDQRLVPLMHDSCPIRERTADGVSVGRCMHYLDSEHVCPRHGDVRVQRDHFIKTGELSEEPGARIKLTPVEMGSLGGKRSAERLTGEQRSQRARMAVRARWDRQREG